MTRFHRFYCDFTDSDGDHITIATSAELATAFHEMTGAVKVFYITVLQRRFEPDLVIEADSM